MAYKQMDTNSITKRILNHCNYIYTPRIDQLQVPKTPESAGHGTIKGQQQTATNPKGNMINNDTFEVSAEQNAAFTVFTEQLQFGIIYNKT